MNLFELGLCVPVVGIKEPRDGVLHAVTMEGLPIKSWPEGRCRAACDGEEVGLYPYEVDGRFVPVLWPPRVRSLPKDWSRCKACFDATPEKRPRATMAPTAVSSLGEEANG